EYSAKFTATPSKVAPRGYGLPGQISRMNPRRWMDGSLAEWRAWMHCAYFDTIADLSVQKDVLGRETKDGSSDRFRCAICSRWSMDKPCAEGVLLGDRLPNPLKPSRLHDAESRRS